MIAQLQQLIAVRETRLRAAQVELGQALTALAEVAGELRLVDDELRQIRDQKALWEGQWQSWLRQDGVLYRGHAYNLRHVSLSSWESDATERWTEIKERYDSREEQAQSIRTTVLKMQQRVDLLKDRLARLCTAQQSHRTNVTDSRALEEMTLHGWAARQSVH
jgi:phage shock protein A